MPPPCTTPPTQQWYCRRRSGFPCLMKRPGTLNAGARHCRPSPQEIKCDLTAVISLGHVALPHSGPRIDGVRGGDIDDAPAPRGAQLRKGPADQIRIAEKSP